MQQNINYSNPDDGFGDKLRNAFIKVQNNFTELFNGKVDKIVGKGLSENDYTDADKSKLTGIEAGAQVNVNADFGENDPSAPGYILNRPPSMYASVGYFTYNDVSTISAPLVLVSGVAKKLTNDTLGVYTGLGEAPYGVSNIWKQYANQFDFSQLAIGDTLDMRVDALLTTTGTNKTYKILLKLGIGTPSEFTILVGSGELKNAVTDENIVKEISFYIGSEDIKNAPAELYLLLDSSGSVKVNGWYTRILRKGLNLIDFNSDPLKLDKVTTADVEKVYIKNADGTQGMKPVSEFKDVLEIANLASFPVTGETGKIYLTLDTNKTYLWSGSIYVQIGETQGVFLGSVIPTDIPTGTGEAFWIATENGTYTNFGGVVVNANSFAFISRSAGGVFSISQTALDLGGYVQSPVIYGETTPSVIGDFTAENGATISMVTDYLKISTIAGQYGYAKLNDTDCRNIEFTVTSNGYINPSPNWIGIGTKDGKKIIIGLKTGLDEHKGQVYSVLNGFGVDSTLIKDADRVSTYSIVSGDVIYVRIKDDEVFVYKKVGEILTELSYNNLSGLGITYGFSFVFTEQNVATQQYFARYIKTKTIGIEQRVFELENKVVVTTESGEKVGYGRKPLITDFTSQNGSVAITGSNVSVVKTGTAEPVVLFSTNIKTIQFTIPTTLIDNTQHSIVIGEGLEGATKTYAYFGFSNNSDGAQVVNLFATNAQSNSMNGGGRLALPNLQPEEIPVRIVSGDVVKITLVDENVIWAEIKKTGTTSFVKWFYFDKRGEWATSARVGWNVGLRLGICKSTGTIPGTYSAFNNLVVSEKTDSNSNLLTEYRLIRDDIKQKMFNKLKPKWLALGDSLTDMDGNNGKSYVGFANAVLGYDLVNHGYGGWTAYKLWRDKAIGRPSGSPTKARWDTEVATADIITICIGTNDFDTQFAIAPNDATMDTYPDPHPRFGTFDPLHVDFKDSHTTLGCIRLIIDYIYTQNAKAKIYIILPPFRLKKNIVGSTLNTWTVNDEGRTIYDYANAIKKVAEEYNLPVVDFIFTAGVNATNIDSYMYDKLHFLEEGGKHYGKILTKSLKS